MNESFVLRILDGKKIQMDVPDFVKFTAALNEFGIDCDIDTPSPAVLVVHLKAKSQ